MLKNRLMTPGPTPVSPEARRALGSPHAHHRTPEFKEVTGRVRAALCRVFRTEAEVVLLTSSGTGAMETALTNLTRPGDTVIVVDSGKFGHRWQDLAVAFGREAVVLVPPDGQAIAPGDVTAALEAQPHATAVFFAACESSTGVRADTRAIAAAAREAAGDRVLKDFAFDVPLKDELFEIKAPEGFRIENQFDSPQLPVKLSEKELASLLALLNKDKRSAGSSLTWHSRAALSCHIA